MQRACLLHLLALATVLLMASPHLRAQDNPDNSSDTRPLVHQFLEDHPEIGRAILNQTVKIIIRPRIGVDMAFVSSGIILNDQTLVTSAHSLGPFLKQLSLAFFQGLSGDIPIVIELSDAWGEIFSQKNTSINSLLSGLSDEISLYSAAEIYTPMMIYPGIINQNPFVPEVDMSFLKLHRETFSQLMGRSVSVIKPDLNYPHLHSVFHTLGYSQKEGALGLRATRFEHDNTFGVLQDSSYSTYARVSRSPIGHNTFGDSGGPLLSYQEGELRLVGIVTGGMSTQHYSIGYYTSFRHPNIVSLMQFLSVEFDEDLTPERFCD